MLPPAGEGSQYPPHPGPHPGSIPQVEGQEGRSASVPRTRTQVLGVFSSSLRTVRTLQGAGRPMPLPPGAPGQEGSAPVGSPAAWRGRPSNTSPSLLPLHRPGPRGTPLAPRAPGAPRGSHVASVLHPRVPGYWTGRKGQYAPWAVSHPYHPHHPSCAPGGWELGRRAGLRAEVSGFGLRPSTQSPG